MLSSRSEAAAAGERHYFTGKPCKHGHASKRLTSTGGCIECYRILKADRMKSDPAYKAKQGATRDAWAKSERGRLMTKESRDLRRVEIRRKDRERWADGRYKPTRKSHYHRVLKLRPQYRIAHNVRTRISGILKGAVNGRSVGRVLRLCGYTIDQLRKHLEAQFTRGMTWSNYGRGGWHIDHITPVADFDQKDDSDFSACWSLGNLRPIWEQANLAKGPRKTHLL